MLNIKNIIFAYEPVWAIGTGKVQNKYELSKNILYIKSQIQNKFKKTQNINIFKEKMNFSKKMLIFAKIGIFEK